MSALLLALALALPAGASRDPVPYRQDLARRVAASAEALNLRGKHQEAIDLCREHGRRLGVAADVAYEEGLAWNALGEKGKARKAYGAAIEADPRHAAARYDRAELLIEAGELDAAEEDLLVAAEERSDHWAAFFRLAELAARRGDADGFERFMMEAVRNGWDLRSVVTDPDWKGFARDPELGAVLKRVATVYYDVAVYEALIAE